MYIGFISSLHIGIGVLISYMLLESCKSMTCGDVVSISDLDHTQYATKYIILAISSTDSAPFTVPKRDDGHCATVGYAYVQSRMIGAVCPLDEDDRVIIWL